MKNSHLWFRTNSRWRRTRADALERAGFSRRAFLKGTGALIVSFSMGGVRENASPAQRTRAGAFGENPAADSPPAGEVDSWIAIGSDGGVTAYTGKEELGQGLSTAQMQLVAEELCVPFHRVNLIVADTSMCPDQGVTSGSQSHPANFNHANLAGAAPRRAKALLQLGSKRLSLPVDDLVAVDGAIRSKTDASKKVAYAELVAGKKFDLKVDPKRSENPPANGPCSESLWAGPTWRRWPPARSSTRTTCACPACCMAPWCARPPWART